MGTRFNLVLETKTEASNEALSGEVAVMLKEEEARMSCYMEEAELSVINRKAAHSAVKVSDPLARVFDACDYFYQATDGAFDAGLLHLTRTLKSGDLSLEEAAVMGEVGWKQVDWNPKTREIKFKGPLAGIDLGGIGKGWAVEKVRDFLLEKGVEIAFISFGESTVATIGTHPLGDCWPLTIHHPVSQVSMLIELKDDALSVSGLKEKGDAQTKEGVPHIIRAANNTVVEEDQLIVVKAPSPLTAEVLSTAVMAANEHQRAVIFDNFPDVSIYECVTGEPVFNRLL
ncbi:thiamin biosynthesis lipoprotein ApbE [Geofilum rubicundum JCM 15548]|uniref:FAD:protein FMN transferase n=2 Tax=Geofilum TaxID=1236988 RepID=A0A0E9LTI7_9BACT|nr:thiamin biosynthesis lipoprotein ApbE [Geofilum rubicundum JCM 15548]